MSRREQAAALLAQNQPERARQLLLSHLRTSPRDPQATRLLAAACARLNLHDQAAHHARAALALLTGAPEQPDAALELALILARAAPTYDQGLALARSLLDTHPSRHALLALVGILRNHPGSPRSLAAADAIEHHLRALNTPPDVDLTALAVGMLLDAGDPDRAIALARLTADRLRNLGLPPRPELASLITHAAHYSPAFDRAALHAAQLDYARALPALDSPHTTTTTNAPAPSSPAPIRLGLLSADLRRHSVAFFLPAILTHLDPDRFHLVVCSLVAQPDAFTATLKALTLARRDSTNQPRGQWINLSPTNPPSNPTTTTTTTPLTAPALAQRLRDLHLDILLDLHGHTDSHRLDALALRPAPLIGTYLGSPGGSGLPGAFRLSDPLCDPNNPTTNEPILHIPAPFLCYSPDTFDPAAFSAATPLPHPQPDPNLTPDTRPFTFVSFNQLPKLSDVCLELWARTLAAVDASRLIIKAKGLADPDAAALLRRRLDPLLATHHVDPARVELLAWLASPADHLALYRRAHLALDSFPYHGTTTTCEALRAGVPVLSLVGHTPAARVGLSLLTAVGLADLAVDSTDAFVRTAADLAANPQRLAAARATLGPALNDSPLCNAPAFAARFANALTRLISGRNE